jgi:hypothetical protein
MAEKTVDSLWLMVETDDGLWNMDAVEGAE